MINYNSLVSFPSPHDGDASFLFSVHKAGSSLFFGMIDDLCKNFDFPGISIPDALFLEGLDEGQWQNDPTILPLFKPGYVYFGFRLFPEILAEYEGFPDARKIFLIRDPRDILVSQYFSFGANTLSHALPNKGQEDFVAHHLKDAPVDINDYVIYHSDFLLEKLIAYHRLFIDYGLFVIRYEDIFFDKSKLLSDVTCHIDYPLCNNIITEVSRRHDIRPDYEDPTKHIRRGFPGDYLNKLEAPTIRRLNSIFDGIMTEFGYSL